MYNNGFVLSITQNGRAKREYSKDGNSVVYVPFNSEYAIRIKNKTIHRCRVDVFIDGTNISEVGSLLLGPYGIINLERFIGIDLNKGKKFKFVPVSSSNLTNSDEDNGVVSVHIYKEKKFVDYRTFYTSSTTLSTSFLNGLTTCGSDSDQSFVTTDTFAVEAIPTILKVKILGTTKYSDDLNVLYCYNCGRKRKRYENYCPKCGKKFIKERHI